MLLGDMGAEVLKIEEPTHGDDTRGWGPFRDGWSTFFLGLNRNKKSVALDLKQPSGAAALRALIKDADVLIENFRPGSLAQLGFAYPDVAALNSRLIYCSVTGYGQTGPKRDLPGYDNVIQGECGLMDVTGPRDGPPTRAGVAITDYLAGLYALSGILLALRSRDQTGEGQHVDIGLLDSMTSALTLPAMAYLNAGELLGREGNQHHSLTPYETLPVRDGLVVVSVGNPRLWTQFCAAIDAQALEKNPRFATNTDRMANREALVADITQRIGAWSREELITRLQTHRVPCGRVNALAEALSEPQLLARNMVIDIPHPALGQVRALGNPIKLSRTPPVATGAPRALGEDTDEVLGSLNLKS